MPTVTGPAPSLARLAAEGDQPLAAQLGGFQGAEPQSEETEAGGFRAPERFADLGQIRFVQCDQLAECLGRPRSGVYSFAAIDPALDTPRPKLRIAAPQEGFADVIALASDLSAPGARGKL
ncbi:MAG: hypothetical protein AB7U46_09625 [Paenirhodobacter sp.]|uniref:hypothetical protein n=1 Tax=Paenirhodobacter sp. TaxID=1965326 RepID=UPI003D0B9D08